MAWIEVMPSTPMDALADAARRLRDALISGPEAAPGPALVPACRCNGQCHCGTLVPYLLHRQLELESEFYRDVH